MDTSLVWSFLIVICFCYLLNKGTAGVCSIDYTETVTNTALNKPAIQISTDFGGDPERAVDGDDSPSYKVRSCSHTKRSERYQWWMVDMLDDYAVMTTMLTNRDSRSDRLRNFDIYVSQNKTMDTKGRMLGAQLCKHEVGPLQSAETRSINCSQPTVGQYVQIYMVVAEALRPLTLCEVKIQAFRCRTKETTDLEQIGSNEITTTGQSSSRPSHPPDGFYTVRTPDNDNKTNCSSNRCSISLGQTATVRNTTANSDPCMCRCVRPSSSIWNLTEETLVQKRKELIQNLTVNRRETSNFQRRLTSIRDDRSSSVAIGYVGGILICLPICFVILSDVINLWNFITRK